ncbi:Predicted nucleotide-binding protein containing TIR-like domain-containing protein [Pseudomonas sp. ok272]|uniref:TIR domain-containing protein n=1 Tax=unclassified Pseudomonas TaxID=196821 RepID=UPI0008C92E73|nr:MULTISPECIES: nucleotide-binding protein [unclassified Pseudomonas]SEN43403.1 Predicted nucleotide-binding protein containing TIR-like domain-containing protein [Pseudomonas sp. ok272]SFN25051.1 Predicted nucleotide-binding protein containing TIR-like domain-containing protein [Pseudomonas sp. ok602]
MSLNYLETRFDKVSYLQNLLIAHATGKPADSSEYQQLRHELLNDNDIAIRLPAWLKHHRDLESFWGFIQPKFSTYAERRTYLSQQFTQLLDELEFGAVAAPNQQSAAFNALPLPQNINVFPIPVHDASGSTKIARNKRNVFIVHGRDNEVKQEVSRFVESIGLKSIILHEQASGGRTIIEKIEHYSGEADFAIVLYTPCDQGRGHHEKQVVGPRDRARQNVVFEHGYLMAKLGRENVCALVKGNIETPNDINGVIYVNLDPTGAWQREIVKELRVCGYEVTSW